MKFICEEKYETNNTSLTIKVYKENKFFYGEWSCCNCLKKGTSSKACKDINEAIEAAKINSGPGHQTCMK